MREALELVTRLYIARSCHYDLPNERPARPCLDHHIGRCLAPCADHQSEAEYGVMVEEIIDILSGHTKRAAQRIDRGYR